MWNLVLDGSAQKAERQICELSIREHSMFSPFAKSTLFSTESAHIMKTPTEFVEAALLEVEDLYMYDNSG